MINESLINKTYDAKGKTEGVCWEFCKEIDPNLPAQPYLGMLRIEKPSLNCVVLFKIGNEWHSGIVWPDCLHFVHARPEKDGTYTIRQERLTSWPWKKLVEGYYVPEV